MTEPINKYHHSKIYRIFAVINGEIQPKVYIGASIQNYLSRRKAQHFDNYRLWKLGRLHKVSTSFDLFDLYGVKNCKIELIEIFKCETKEDLHKRELQVIKATPNCVNNHIQVYEKSPAGDEERKKHSIEYRKNYRAINKVRIQQYMFAYNFKKKQERENISIQIVEPNENIL